MGGCFTAELLELIGSRKVEILVGSGALLHIDEAHIVAQRKRIVLIDLHAGAQTCANVEAAEIKVAKHTRAFRFAKEPYCHIRTHFKVELIIRVGLVAVAHMHGHFQVVRIVGIIAFVGFLCATFEREQRAHIAINGILVGEKLEVF